MTVQSYISNKLSPIQHHGTCSEQGIQSSRVVGKMPSKNALHDWSSASLTAQTGGQRDQLRTSVECMLSRWEGAYPPIGPSLSSRGQSIWIHTSYVWSSLEICRSTPCDSLLAVTMTHFWHRWSRKHCSTVAMLSADGLIDNVRISVRHLLT
jgi:hypothetical protein